jgi:hypothetical protein
MATPVYKGAGQPTAAGGWLSGLTSWFGGPAPAYVGKGQAAQGSTGYLGGATPAYKPAPAPTDGTSTTPSATTEECREPERITVLIPRELIEPQ